jgi:hypothetical protein
MRKPELGKSGLAVRYWLLAIGFSLLAVRRSPFANRESEGRATPANSKRRIANDALSYDAQRGGQSG